MVYWHLSLSELVTVPVAISFLITFFFVPLTVKVAKARGIVARENGRTSHKGSIPTMGGLAVFSGFYISVLIFVNDVNFRELNTILAGSFLILLSGMKDDMIGISWQKKLFIQFLAGCLMIFWADIRLSNLQGFFGIYEINMGWSVALTLLTIVGLTNCFNLIDGIDGLASGLGGLSLVTMGICFWFTGHIELAQISFILVAALIAFIPFNLYGKSNKIFMGDTGSLTMGFIISVMIIKFNQVLPGTGSSFAFTALPALSIAIVFIPLFDTLRVFIIRICKRKNPFSPDKIHTHHVFLGLGLSHGQTSLVLVGLNLGFILLAFFSAQLGTTILLFILFLSGIVIFSVPCARLRRKQRKKEEIRVRN
ncbi:MAG: MraY family glycosyltransferase [Bacteroidales bacterium]|nr:MraY family glycosyltransferase [Bacteroidales bacterium]